MNPDRTAAPGVCIVLIGAAASVGDVVTFDANGGPQGSFHVALNWDTNTVPTDEDRIVIPPGKTCNVVANDEIVEFTVDTMEVRWDEVPGILNIDDGITLILENDDDNIGSSFGPTNPDHSIIEGAVNVGTSLGSGGTLYVKQLWIDVDEHVFSGDGMLRGEGNSVIQIQSGKTLSNLLGASGTGAIVNDFLIHGGSGGATLNNEGTIVAADPGADLILDSSLALSDVANAIWGTGFCTSTMTFEQDASLDGDFVHYNNQAGGNDGGGSFVLGVANIDVATCGRDVVLPTCPAGWGWTVASGATFSYTGFGCSLAPGVCATCGSTPCDTCPGSPNCATPLVISDTFFNGNCGA